MQTRWFKIFLLVTGLVLAAVLKFRTADKKILLNGNEYPDQFLVVLGIAQDGGFPQIGCNKACCQLYWKGKEAKKLVTCLALVDRPHKQYWLIDATPDITAQLRNVQHYLPEVPDYSPDGIFLTHAHIGHYSGLMQLGREAMGASRVPVYALPRMDSFLRNNGPWSQLVNLENISLRTLKADSSIYLTDSIAVTPFIVPHRDEYSETAGYEIVKGDTRMLFIPDIDKWSRWDKHIEDIVKHYSVILVDGTFYQDGELPGRNMKEIPHPFVQESQQLFASLPDSLKERIYFIHFNHTNPLLKLKSAEKDQVKAAGFRVAEEGMVFKL